MHEKQDKHRSDLKWDEQRSSPEPRVCPKQDKYQQIAESTASPETVQIQKFTRNGMNRSSPKPGQIQGNNRKYCFTRNSTDTKVIQKWDE